MAAVSQAAKAALMGAGKLQTEELSPSRARRSRSTAGSSPAPPAPNAPTLREGVR